jgi:hypothetical protein
MPPEKSIAPASNSGSEAFVRTIIGHLLFTGDSVPILNTFIITYILD